MGLANQMNLLKYITWTSGLSDQMLMERIKKSHLLLLLSNSEAYGIIVAESLALGTPVLVAKKAALSEFLGEPGCFGVDYPPDPTVVANTIVNLCKSEIRVGPFTDKIRTWDKVAEEYEKLYKGMIV